jgi:hypothetical protein
VTTPEATASRREVDQLREDLHRLDEHGTRGVSAMQVQLTDLLKDVIELKTDVGVRFDAHEREHDKDEDKRVQARRWLIGAGIAGAASVAAVVGLLIDVLSHLH